jgi:DEAD/DEAH box helicase domain-containing protein
MADQQLDALKLASQAKQRLVDFSLADLFCRDPQVQDILGRMWSGDAQHGGLMSDLWVEGAFPSEGSGLTLQNFVEREGFSKKLSQILDRNGGFGKDWELHTHQAASIVEGMRGYTQREKPSLVISAGTGAGKTECFLLPMLNQLFQSQPNRGQGVSTIILYPMNALVNDQVDRLERWLRGQDSVTLFHFTSETPEDHSAFKRDNFPEPEICRFRTRNHARGMEERNGKRIDGGGGEIPQILITNYSMLEYMLCRPQDQVFFGSNLTTLILDEAHLYTGTLAAEMTLLLRRLLHRCGRLPTDVINFATSATIGGNVQTDLAEFIGKLFSKSPTQVVAIEGMARRHELPAVDPHAPAFNAVQLLKANWPSRACVEMDNHGKSSLRFADSGEAAQWQAVLEHLCSSGVVRAAGSGDTTPIPIAALLKRVIEKAPVVHQMENILWEHRRIPLSDLTSKLLGVVDADHIEATRRILFLAAAARDSLEAYPVIPNRIHFIVRAPSGVTCFYDEAPEAGGIPWNNATSTYRLSPGMIDRCPVTGRFGLGLLRCSNCGQWHWAGMLNGVKLRAPTAQWMASDAEIFHPPAKDKNEDIVYFDPESGEVCGAGEGKIALAKSKGRCRHCGEENHFRPFAASTRLYIGIFAETLLAGLPEMPSPAREWLPARGRRLLTFSDSRAEAARLGSRLTSQHELQLVRAAFARTLAAQSNDDSLLEFYREQIKQAHLLLERTTDPATRSALESQIRSAQAVIDRTESGGSIADWAARLCESPIASELINVQQMERHDASWQQKDWERNRLNQAAFEQLLCTEFANRSRWPYASLETMGLVEVVYPRLNQLQPPDTLLGRLPAAAIPHIKESWASIIALMCDSLRTEGAVTLGSKDLDFEFPSGFFFVGRWASLDYNHGTMLFRFRGATINHSRNAFLWRLAQKWGVTEGPLREAFIKDLMEAVFAQLKDSSLDWVETENRQTDAGTAPAVRLKLKQLALRKPLALYQCRQTGQVWTRHAAADAPASVGLNLHPVTAAQLDLDPRIGRQRRELQESPVFETALWSEEHSAQLSPGENRRLQDLFKLGVRNILSSTTTLELGIDIGGLNAVMMGNLPPGKANYLQRAGRAGRRADGSSVVTAFARNQTFDNQVFHRFSDYLDAPLRRPRIFLDRERLVRRQLNSFLLGAFFQSVATPGQTAGAMQAFGRMGHFCGLPFVQYWERNIADKPPLMPADPAPAKAFSLWPQALPDGSPLAHFFPLFLNDAQSDTHFLTSIRSLLAATALADKDFEALLEEVENAFEAALKLWRKDYDTLLNAWQSLDPQQDHVRAVANAIRYQLQAFHEMTVIEAFADLQFLPRYGFPIGLSKLRVVTSGKNHRLREEDCFRLQRAAIHALSDYLPGSKLLVGGKVIASHGILKHWTGNDINAGIGVRGTKTQCTRGHSYYSLDNNPGVCPHCESPGGNHQQSLLFPRFGFTTAAWDPPRRSNDFERVGSRHQEILFICKGATQQQTCKDFGGVASLTANYWQDAEVLATNAGENGNGFVICLRCGFAVSEPEKMTTAVPKEFLHHASLFSDKAQSTCSPADNISALRKQVFAARQSSDLLLLDFSKWVSFSDQAATAKLLGIAQAMRTSGCRLLEIDDREIGILTNVPGGLEGDGRCIALFDTLPGGAGHVYDLMQQADEWLLSTLQQLFISESHHENCETGCLDCILSFDQDRLGIPDRKGAHALLSGIMQQSQPSRTDDPSNGDLHKVSELLANTRKSDRPNRRQWLELENSLREGDIEAELLPLLRVAAEVRCVPALGYELQDKQGKIVATAPLAWPDRRLAAVSAAYDSRVFSENGWKVVGETIDPDSVRQMLTDGTTQ